MKRAGSETGIVRFVSAADPSQITQPFDAHSDAHKGFGMLLDERTIVTCAHVVNAALGLGMYTQAAPGMGTTLPVSFPILGDEHVVQARLVDWSSPGLNGLDCAVIRLEEPAPAAVGQTILSIIPQVDLIDVELSVYGSLGLRHPGAHLNARLLGDVGAQWSQLDILGRFGAQPGFSGGVVWDRKQRTAIGMIVTRQLGSEGTTAYFLPAQRIAERFGKHLPIEVRRTALSTQWSFRLAAVIMFVLVLIHYMFMQGSTSQALVPWTDGSKELSAFWGAHCFAVILGPFVMWYAYQHARSFARRNWWQRVPALLGGAQAAMLDHTKFTALMVILFLLFLPIYAQGAFLKKLFYNERPVFVNVARFNHLKVCLDEKVEQKPAACEAITTCQIHQPSWCRHQDVSAWSFLPTRPYFDHAYQIAGTCKTEANDDCKLQTFFPLLQPAILFAATLYAYAYFFLFLGVLFRSRPHPVSTQTEN